MKIGNLDLAKEMSDTLNSLRQPGGMTRTEPGLVAGPSPFAPKQRQLSDAAAQAAQNMIDLQIEVEQLKAEGNHLRSHIEVIEETNSILVAELEVLKKNNKSLERENIVIHTRLRTAADIIVDIMKPLEPEPKPEETSA